MYWVPPPGATHGDWENEPIIIDITSITIALLTRCLSTYIPGSNLRRIINLGSSSTFLFFCLQIIFDCKFMPNFKVVTNRLSPIIANNLVSLDDLKPHSDKALSFICQLQYLGHRQRSIPPNRVHLSRPNVYLAFDFILPFCSCFFLNFYQGFRFFGNVL